MAFWHKEYASIIEALQGVGKPLGGVADFLMIQQPAYIILRHDVDRQPQQACDLALLEQRLGVRSTYYFRANAFGVFPGDAISMIAHLGHEAGYHYEDLSFCKGNQDAAITRFMRNLATLRKLAPCTTVSMHGAPLSKYHNQELLREEDIQRAMLLGDAVASIERFAPYYLTDTGGRWLAAGTNLRDRVGLAWPDYALPVSLPALRQFAAGAPCPLYVSTHPERWSKNWPSYMRAQTTDMIANGIKLILRHVRPIAQ